MTTIRTRFLIAAALLWISSSISIHAYARPVDASDGTGQLTSTLLPGNGEIIPFTLSPQGISAEDRNPFDRFIRTPAHAGARAPNTLSAAPAAYPAQNAGTTGWSPTHLEEHLAQWQHFYWQQQ
jgi:hypothetical protein